MNPDGTLLSCYVDYKLIQPHLINVLDYSISDPALSQL